MRMNGWLMRQFRSRTADPPQGPGEGTPQPGNPSPVLGFLGDAVQGIADFLSRPIPLSYLIASVFLGSLLALFAVWVVPSVFERAAPSPPRQTEVFVARLTGAVGAEWADPDTWLVNTPNPWGKAAVVQQNGRVELANRGMLITKSQYPPEVHDTVRITGQWTFVQSGEMPNMDIMTVTIHSTGEPAGRYGQATGGLAFFCYAGLDFLDIQYLGNGFLIDFVKRTGKLRIREGESYRFDIMPPRQNLWVKEPSQTLRRKYGCLFSDPRSCGTIFSGTME